MQPYKNIKGKRSGKCDAYWNCLEEKGYLGAVKRTGQWREHLDICLQRRMSWRGPRCSDSLQPLQAGELAAGGGPGTGSTRREVLSQIFLLALYVDLAVSG